MVKSQPGVGAAVSRPGMIASLSRKSNAVSVRKKTGLALALVTVLAAGASSALFVDYLADRARARAATDIIPAATPSKPQVAAVAELPRPVPAKPAAPAKPQVAEVKAAPSEGWVVAVASAEPISPARIAAQAAGAEADDGLPIELSSYAGEGSDNTLTAAIGSDEVPVPTLKSTLSASASAEDDAEEEDATGKPARTARSVTMRSGPNQKAGPIGTIPGNARIGLIGCKSWCEVTYQGKRGFIYKSFVGKS